jgi:hypothetical protein
VLNPAEQSGVEAQRQREREEEMAQRPAQSHAAGCAIRRVTRQAGNAIKQNKHADFPGVIATQPAAVVFNRQSRRSRMNAMSRWMDYGLTLSSRAGLEALGR